MLQSGLDETESESMRHPIRFSTQARKANAVRRTDSMRQQLNP